jgi:mevalonate pyrophosphate decarboxylase
MNRIQTLRPVRRRDERGMATAELLANSALGVAALAAIWFALQALGADVIEFIRDNVF